MLEEKIRKAKVEKRPVLFKGILPTNSDWNYIMNYINNKFNETPKYQVQNDRFFKNKKDKTVPMLSNSDLNLQAWGIKLPECKNLSDTFSITNKVNESSFKLLIDFLGFGNLNNIHKDKSEVYSWTLINSVEYRIYGNKNEYPFEETLEIGNEPYESFIIEAGDVMYMPKGVVHQSVVNEPRVSLIASFL